MYLALLRRGSFFGLDGGDATRGDVSIAREEIDVPRETVAGARAVRPCAIIHMTMDLVRAPCSTFQSLRLLVLEGVYPQKKVLEGVALGPLFSSRFWGVKLR